MRLGAVVIGACCWWLGAAAKTDPATAAVPWTPRVPGAVIVATSRGEASVQVRVEQGHAAVPVPPLLRLLPLTVTLDADWATIAFAGQPFQFLLGAPVVLDGGRIVPLTGGAYLAHDTLFVPLQWLTDYVPRRFREGYRYDPVAGRFEEAGLAPVVRTASAPPARPSGSGLRTRRTVAIDAGHGGTDPGSPCLFCPRGVTEKHVTLAIAKQVQRELERRGVSVIMTRTADTLISLYERAKVCMADCDLFVSIHVDALARRRGSQRVGGIHTYFLGEALTDDARRVAAVENDALRYEAETTAQPDDPTLFILKHLQANEILRESALLAELVQSQVAGVHPGGDRGVQQNRLVVLTTARRPAVLIETGYGTNKQDAQFLASAKGQQRLAAAIADGVIEYLRRYEAKTQVGETP
jgi:N-acetylmuramoyl-L-alanine amidase